MLAQSQRLTDDVERNLDVVRGEISQLILNIFEHLARYLAFKQINIGGVHRAIKTIQRDYFGDSDGDSVTCFTSYIGGTHCAFAFGIHCICQPFGCVTVFRTRICQCGELIGWSGVRLCPQNKNRDNHQLAVENKREAK